MNVSHRQRWLAIIAGLAVLVLILDRVVFTPLVRTWDQRSTEIVTLEKSIAKGRNLKERGPRMESLWKEMQANALPKDAAQAEQDLISSLDGWGRTSGVDLGSIKPQWRRGATDRYSTLECRIDASGNLAALTRFLFEVEKSPLALRVDSVELASRDDNGQKLALDLVVSGLRLAPLEGRL